MAANRTGFEKRIEAALDETKTASIKVQVGDSHQHALIQGRYAGLEQALKIYREVNRADLDDEDA